MQSEIDLLRRDIMIQMYELQEIVPVIESLDKDLIQSSDEEMLLYFQESVEYYNKMIKKLRISLEAYFAEEAKAGLPVEISFRRAYKRLLTA
jgi:hypothetical protein